MCQRPMLTIFPCHKQMEEDPTCKQREKEDNASSMQMCRPWDGIIILDVQKYTGYSNAGGGQCNGCPECCRVQEAYVMQVTPSQPLQNSGNILDDLQ